jgi:hypothetical protein
LLVKLVDTGHDVRGKDVVLVVGGRVADGRVVSEVRNVFARSVSVNCVVRFVNWFRTRYDSNRPCALR